MGEESTTNIIISKFSLSCRPNQAPVVLGGDRHLQQQPSSDHVKGGKWEKSFTHETIYQVLSFRWGAPSGTAEVGDLGWDPRSVRGRPAAVGAAVLLDLVPREPSSASSAGEAGSSSAPYHNEAPGLKPAEVLEFVHVTSSRKAQLFCLRRRWRARIISSCTLSSRDKECRDCFTAAFLQPTIVPTNLCPCVRQCLAIQRGSALKGDELLNIWFWPEVFRVQFVHQLHKCGLTWLQSFPNDLRC